MEKKSGIGSVGKRRNRKYYKHNYIDVIKTMVPSLYEDTDYSIYGSEEDILYTVLGKVMKTAEDIKVISNVSGYDVSALRRLFISRNNLTNIKPFTFEQKILKPLQTSFDAFPNRTAFKSYVSSTLLHKIPLNKPTTEFQEGVETYVDSTIDSLPKVHNYLFQNLSWLYVLNSKGPTNGFDPSAAVVSGMMQIYDNHTFTEGDGVKLLFEYLWRNRDVTGAVGASATEYLPPLLGKSNTEVTGLTFASGNQQLDNLKTLVDVWYEQADETSTTLDDYLDLYLTNGSFEARQVAGGAFEKFLQAVSFGFYDVNLVIEELGDLLDIERCPPQFLHYLASLIGWQLMTGDADRWRAQLRKAVYLYKSKGTKRALEDAIDLVFPGKKVDAAKNINETWECFLPRMIYYLIATESAVLNDPAYNANTIPGIPSHHFSVDTPDLNYRFATDYVIKAIHENTPPTPSKPEGGAIYFGEDKFDLATWEEGNPDFKGFQHRGVDDVPVPPWENDRFYDNSYITSAQFEILEDILKGKRDAKTGYASLGGGLEIPESYVDSLLDVLKKSNYNTGSVYNLSWNDKFKFYTSSMEVPPNLSSVIASGDGSKLNLIDYWSSKSSLVYSNIELSALSHSIGEASGVAMDVPTIMHNVNSIFKQFAPFHVVFKLFATESLTDTYNQTADIFAEDGFCVRIFKNDLNLSANGDTDQYIFNNLVTTTLTVSSVAGAPVKVVHADKPRGTGRRRNLKYNNAPHYFSRNGTSMPVPHAFNSSRKAEHSSVSSLLVNSRNFIPLGFNFSSGDFYSTSGDFSAVYAASNDLSMSAMPLEHEESRFYIPAGNRDGIMHSEETFFEIPVSSTFPCRAPFVNPTCDVAVQRQQIPAFKQVIIKHLIKRGDTESFDDEALDNFSFGSDVHGAYFDYIRYFNKNFKLFEIKEFINNQFHRTRNSGGRYIGAHIYGPILANNQLTYSGRLNLDDISTQSAYVNNTTDTIAFYPHWKFIFNNPSMNGKTYTSVSGITYNLSSSVFDTTNDIPTESHSDDTKYLHTSGQLFRVCKTALEHVDLVGKAAGGTESFAVVNEVSSVFAAASGSVPELGGRGSVSLFNQEPFNNSFDDCASLRFSLDGNKNFIKNGNFKYLPSTSGNEIGTDYTSSLAGWELIHHDDTPTAYSGGTNVGDVVVSSISGAGDRVVRYVRATASGPGAEFSSDSCILRTSNKGVRAIKGLIPGKSYTLSVSYENLDSACSGIRYNLRNLSAKERGQISDWNGSAWITAASASVPVLPASTSMITSKVDVSVSSGFLVSDEYRLDLYFQGNVSSTPGIYASSLSITHVSAVNLVEANSSRPNNLLPDRSYEMTIRAKSKYASDSLAVKFYTDPIPELDFTDYADRDLNTFSFNINRGIWENLNKSNNSWNIIPMTNFNIEYDSSGEPTGWKTLTLTLNTKNNATRYNKQDTTFVRHGHLPHHENTAYFLEFIKANSSTQKDSFITIDSVSLKDVTYAGIAAEYELADLNTIFAHFDLMANGKQSRDSDNSYLIYGTNGGARGTYIEAVGGSNLGVTDPAPHPYGQGLLYDLSDD